MQSDAVLRATGLVKAYGGVLALNKVDFAIRPGEVRALMGKNGAGKSTLVKIISGATSPTLGDLQLGGRTVSFGSPAEATASGIATVHQELTIIPGLTVAENITLGNWPARGGILDTRKVLATARAALAQLGETIDVAMRAGELSIAKQQIVEIARALALNPKILILDEPTSSLPAHEVEALLTLVRKLGQGGVSVIYVSHRMDEIARVAHSVTVLRDGRLIETVPITEAPTARIAQLMVGRDIDIEGRGDIADAQQEVALDASGLMAGPHLASAALRVRKGEILGVAGLLGSGRTELLRVLAGADRARGGSITVAGRPIARPNIRRMLRNGIALVPEDRKREGAVLGMSIVENLSMSSMSRVSKGGILDTKTERALAHRSRSLLDIKAGNLAFSVETLSGGNQQKVVIGRCLNAEIDVLLLDEPTRGVDVLAKQQIYALIKRLAADGKAIVLVSSEYEELLLLAHRIIIMAEGHVMGEVDPVTTRMDELMTRLLAANDELRARSGAA